MNFIDFIFENNPVHLVAKVIISLGLAFYILFAFVVIKQVGKMTETLEVGLETPLRIVSLLHFLIAVLALIAALVIL